MAVAALTTRERSYEVGDKVVFKVQFNNPGHYKPETMVPGEVICRYENGGGFTYRIRLDVQWNDRVASRDRPIIVGNVRVGRLFPKNEG